MYLHEYELYDIYKHMYARIEITKICFQRQPSMYDTRVRVLSYAGIILSNLLALCRYVVAGYLFIR